MDYLISPPEKKDWEITESQFIDLLLAEWPDAKLLKVNDENRLYPLTWIIELEGLGLLEGGLQKDMKCIGLSGSLEVCAVFAVWFRKLVPEPQSLLFYDQEFNFNLLLTHETNISKIKSVFCG